MNKKMLIIGAMVILTIWLGCGSKPTKSSLISSPDVTNITIVNFAFNPATITVTKGSTVKWTNQDEAPHTVTSDGSYWDSGELNKGLSFNHTFNQTGTFTYHCAVHPSMKGTIVVTE
jgi:plastocyanin